MTEEVLPDEKTLTLVLGKDWLKDTDAARLAQDVFPEKNLIIDNVVEKKNRATTSVIGVTSLLGLKAVPVHIMLHESGTPNFTLTASLPQGWSISDSYVDLPVMPPKLINGELVEQSVLQMLTLSNVQLVLTSHPFHDKELDVQLVRGLNIIAQLELPSILKQLDFFSNYEERYTLVGLLHDGSDEPVIDIRFPVSFSLELGPLKLRDTAIRFYSSLNKWQFSPLYGLEFVGTVEVGKSRCQLATDIPIDEDDPTFLLCGKFTDTKPVGLAGISEMLGAEDLFDNVPSSLSKAITSIELQNLKTGFSTKPFSFNYIGFTIGSNASWSPIENILEIKEISLDGLIVQPTDSTRRKFNLTLNGEICIDNAIVEVSIEFSSPKLYGALREGDKLRVGALMKKLLPKVKDIPELLISHLVLEADIDESSFSLELAMDGVWPVPIPGLDTKIEEPTITINRSPTEGEASTNATLSGVLRFGNTRIAVTAELGKTFSLEGSAAEISLNDITQTLFKNFPVNVPELAIKNTTVYLSSNGLIEFNCSCDNVPLIDFAEKIGAPLPEGLATDIRLSTVYLRADLSQKNDCIFRIHAELPSTLSFPENSDHHIDLFSVELNWSTKEGIGCQLELGGSLNLATGVEINVPKFVLGYNSSKNWYGTADVTAAIYEREFSDFVASVRDGKFSLSCELDESVGNFLSVPNIVACRVEHFSVFVDRSEENDQWKFSVGGGGYISIGSFQNPYLKTDFLIEISQDELQLKARDPDPILIQLSTLPPQPSLELDFKDLSLQWNKKKSEFFVAGVGSGTLNNLPDIVRGQFFPEQLPTVDLNASTKGLEITSDFSHNPLTPDVQIFYVAGKPVGPKIEISKLGVKLGDNPTICSELHLSKLSDLNYLFGRKKDGDPKVNFLKDNCQMNLSIGKDPVLELRLESSPFEKFDFETDNLGKQYFIADFRDSLNKLKVNVPELNYSDKGGWSGSFGIKILDPPLKIPLTPLKYLMSQLGAPEIVTNAIPQSVPIDVVDVRKHKKFRGVLEAALGDKSKVDKIYENSAASATLHEFDRVVWQTIREGVDRMPIAFRDYVSPPDIKELNFNIGAKPGGGWFGGFSTGDGKPLKFMLPFVSGPIPELVGFSLSSFELGQATAGVATFKIDGAIDRFDLVTLVVAVLNNETKILSKEQVDNLTNHLKLQNVFGVSCVGFPVPIPILFDNISWQYKNWWGLEGIVDWTSQLGKETNIWSIIGALMPFFTQKDYRLADIKNRSGDQLRLNLRVGPNFFKLPDYLGGKEIGPKEGTPTLPADVSVRWWLDACKFFNPGYAVRSIPLKNPNADKFIRLGHEKVSLGPLEVEAGWCITTENEFREEIIGNTQAEEILSAIDVTKTLEHLPRKQSGVAYDRGFIIILAGGANLAKILEYKVQFGIAVTSTGGFETRIFMEGGISNVVMLGIEGGIHVTPEGTTRIDGSCELKVANRSLIKIEGLIQVTDHSFLIGVKLTLASVLEIGGELYIGKEGVYIEGGFAWSYAAGNQITAAKVRANFDAKGMLITLQGQKIFGSDCTVGLYVNEKGVPGALISFDLTGLNDLFIDEINKQLDEVKETVKQERNGLEQLIKNNVTKVDNFDQLRRGLPGILDSVRENVGSKVKSQANKAWDDLSKWKKGGAAVAGYSKTKVRNKAVTEAQNFLKPLDTLKNKLVEIENKKIQDDKKRVQQTRATIIKALDDSIKINGKKVPIKFWAITLKNIKVTFDTKPFKDLKSLVNQLPDDWSKAEEQRANIANTFASRASEALIDITNNIVKHGKDQAPQLQSIKLDTSLDGLKGPQVTVDVTIKQGSKSKNLQAEVNLTNLAKSMSAITKSFVQAIA